MPAALLIALGLYLAACCVYGLYCVACARWARRTSETDRTDGISSAEAEQPLARAGDETEHDHRLAA